MKQKILLICGIIFSHYPSITVGQVSQQHNPLAPPTKTIEPLSALAKQTSQTSSLPHATAVHQQAIQDVLKHSIFLGELPPSSLANGKITTYDPIMIGLAASLNSTQSERDDSLYTTVELPTLPNSDICPHPIKAFVKRSQTRNAYTFVIFPGSYTTWQSGQFISQTSAVLEKTFDDPHIIAFEGYLSTEFLEDSCEKIPWDAITLAKDLYARLKVYLSETSNPARTGIISFSGGAGLALVMMGEDASNGVFGLGGAAFSPTLHGQTVFYNLDTSVKEIPHSDTITTYSWDWNYIKFASAIKFFSEDPLLPLMEFYNSDPQHFRERAMNELTLVKLKQTITGLHLNAENIIGNFSYYNVFINTGIRQDHPDLTSSEELSALYQTKLNIIPFLKKIKKPVLIYTSQDDPITSSYNNSGQPTVITKILKEAQTNSFIMVFNPRYGGHNGVLLEPLFEHLIQAMFLPVPQKSSNPSEE